MSSTCTCYAILVPSQSFGRTQNRILQQGSLQQQARFPPRREQHDGRLRRVWTAHTVSCFPDAKTLSVISSLTMFLCEMRGLLLLLPIEIWRTIFSKASQTISSRTSRTLRACTYTLCLPVSTLEAKHRCLTHQSSLAFSDCISYLAGNKLDYNISQIAFDGITKLANFTADGPDPSATCASGDLRTAHDVKFCVLSDTVLNTGTIILLLLMRIAL